MNKGLAGLAVKVFLGGVAAIVLLALIWAALPRGEGDTPDDELGKLETVIDRKSGITWQMHGTPELEETTSKLGASSAAGVDVPVRIYTVDHGSWIERVQVFDVAPGEIDFTEAARSTFGATEPGELGKLKYVKVGQFDAATGRAPGVGELDGKEQDLAAQVFAAQMHSYMVTGGIAQPKTSAKLNLAAETTTMIERMHAA